MRGRGAVSAAVVRAHSGGMGAGGGQAGARAGGHRAGRGGGGQGAVSRGDGDGAAGVERRLWLPDPDDVHVLAAAVAGSAESIVTMNAADFPRGVLAEEGVVRIDPDHFLLTLWDTDRAAVDRVAEAVAAEASRLSGEDWTPRRLMKRGACGALPRWCGARGKRPCRAGGRAIFLGQTEGICRAEGCGSGCCAGHRRADGLHPACAHGSCRVACGPDRGAGACDEWLAAARWGWQRAVAGVCGGPGGGAGGAGRGGDGDAPDGAGGGKPRGGADHLGHADTD